MTDPTILIHPTGIEPTIRSLVQRVEQLTIAHLHATIERDAAVQRANLLAAELAELRSPDDDDQEEKPAPTP